MASCATNRAYIPVVPDGYRIPVDFKVVGYFPSWSGDPETIQYRALTHICYAFAVPAANGDISPIENEGKLRRLVALGHSKDKKILLSLGNLADGDVGRYEKIAADPRLADYFSDRLLDVAQRYDLDGVDVDWEFPTEASAPDYARFIHALALKLHGAGKLLSVAVSADSLHGQYYDDSIMDDADFINIMAYDDGLDRPPGENHSGYWFASSSLDYWIGFRHMPRSKAVLGLPFYGRSLIDHHAMSYYRIHKADRSSSAKDASKGYGYNGFDTMRAKAVNLARYRGCGIMIWQLEQDAEGADSLLNAIFDAIKEPLD